MTASSDEDGREDGYGAATAEELDLNAGPSSSPAQHVPLHGPCDAVDLMCAKVLFSLCGSVFPHPLLLAQQLLGIEDQDFQEFQLNVAEAGNNCIDIVAAYLTNLRVMQSEDESNPPVSLAMIQPRHQATVASVAAKARDLMTELALARSSVKPRKAPKNKAIESAARAASAAASPASTGPSSVSSAGASSTGTHASSGDTSGNSTDDNSMSDGGVGPSEDANGSDSNDDSNSSWGGRGHQDTSRTSDTPRTAREEEEWLLYALQGPAAAEETIKKARAQPAGCKSGSSGNSGEDARLSDAPASLSHPAPGAHASPSGGGGGGSGANNASASPVPSGSPRAVPPPPPPPARASSAMSQHSSVLGGGGAGNGFGCSGGTGQRYGQESTRVGNLRGGGGSAASRSAANLQSALSCPTAGFSEASASTPSPLPGSGGNSSTGMAPPSHNQGSQRRAGAHQQHCGGTNGAGAHSRRGGNNRGPPAPPLATLHQQHQQQHQQQQQQQQLHQQQQQQLAVAQMLGLRGGVPYGNSYGNLMALQGAFAGANGLSQFNAGGGGRLDLSLSSVAATTAALELAAAQQVAAQQAAAMSAAASSMHHLGQHVAYGGPYGGQGGTMSGLGQLASQLGPAGVTLVQHQQQAAAAAAAAALLQQSGGMMLSDPLKGGADAAWSSMFLQGLAAGSLS